MLSIISETNWCPLACTVQHSTKIIIIVVVVVVVYSLAAAESFFFSFRFASHRIIERNTFAAAAVAAEVGDDAIKKLKRIATAAVVVTPTRSCGTSL